MGCSCTIEAFDDENDFYDDRYIKARKPHRCCECNGAIEPGDLYERVTLQYEERWSHYSTCMLCVEIRSCFCCSWCFTQVFESIQEEVCDLELSGLESISKEARDKFFNHVNIFDEEED